MSERPTDHPYFQGSPLMFRSAMMLMGFAAVLSLAAPFAAAHEDGKHDNVDKNHLAVQGYDVVSYFTADKPSKGDKTITAQHAGHVWHFATAANRDLFLASPEKYEPQYGGWCATAMAEGDKVAIDPTNYKITDGKLYLFYKGFLGDARKPWLKDEAALAAKADEAWKKLTAK
jgi:hypothetical protein